MSAFPHPPTFEVGGQSFRPEEIIDALFDQISEPRRQRIDRVVANRTYSAVTVLDGIYDQGNVSAVLRSVEGLGFAEVHILETQEKLKTSRRIAQGADKWLDIHRWKSVVPAVEQLRTRGYRIVATHLEAATPLDEIDFSVPTAVVFGNEKDGVSDEIIAQCDERVIIPMMGFAQSFNISVAAAIGMNSRSRHDGRKRVTYSATRKIRLNAARM